MKNLLKISILGIFLIGSFQYFSLAEGEKVIIDPVTKKIIIQSGDQNLNLDDFIENNKNKTNNYPETTGEKQSETTNINDIKTSENKENSNTNTSSDKTATANTLYKDLDSGEEIDKAIFRMYENGLTKYNNLKDFRPDDPLLREEAAKIIGQAYNILGYPNEIKNDNCSFQDSEIFNPELSSYIYSTCSFGIFRGSNGKFLAQKPLSKAESLTVLIRILEGDLSSEAFDPRWTLYFVKAKNIYLTNETNVDGLDREITRREIALLIYRFKNIILNEELEQAAKNQLTTINKNPNQYINTDKENEFGKTNTSGDSTITNNDFLGVLSGVEFNSTSSLSILNSPEVVEAIQRMRDHGLTNAGNATEYNPFDYLTREQAAKMFAQFAKTLKYSQLSGESNSCNFNDLDNADPTLKSSIKEACNLGIMIGNNGEFSPTTIITKSQFITMLIRLYEGKRLDESGNPWRANYFLKAGELGILNAGDISSFEGLITRYEAALLFYRFQLKQTINSGLNTENLKNELLSSMRNSEGNYITGDVESSYAITIDSNLLKNQFFQEGFLELLGTRYKLKKTDITIFDLGDESFVWYGDLINLITDSKIGTVNFIVSNGSVIQGTLRLQNPSQTREIKESKNTTARYNLIQS